jgi:hypothetical protein
VSYRDDLDAAHARIAALEGEIAELKRDAAAAAITKPMPAPKPPKPHASRRLGRVYFHGPHTYVPLLRLYPRAAALAFRRRPGMRPFDSDNVLAWAVVNFLLRPLVIGVWMPIYCAGLALGLPVLGALVLVLSAPMVPIVLAGHLSFNPNPPSRSGWYHGDPDDSDAEGLLILLVFGPMFMLFLPAMFDDDVWRRR